MNGMQQGSGSGEFIEGIVTVNGKPLEAGDVRGELAAKAISLKMDEYVEVADAYVIPEELAEDDRSAFEVTDALYTGVGAQMHDRSTGTFETMGWDNTALF